MSGEDKPSFWVPLSGPAPGGGTHVNLTRREGRWVVTGVYVHGPEVTPSILQAVPVSQIERQMNLVNMSLHDLETVIKYGGYRYELVEDSAGELKLSELRAAAEDAPAEFLLVEQRERPKLTRPSGSDPDVFYARVADAYREHAVRTRAPAVAIAEEANVPVGTAHGWIREARRRGHLPQGRKGKAG